MKGTNGMPPCLCSLGSFGTFRSGTPSALPDVVESDDS